MPRTKIPDLAPGERAVSTGETWVILAAPAAARTRVPADDALALFTLAEQRALQVLAAKDSPAGADARVWLEQFRAAAVSGGIAPATFAAGLALLATLKVVTDARAAEITAAARARLTDGDTDG